MKPVTLLTASVIIASSLVLGCGGDSGGGDGVRLMAGVWTGALTKEQDNCVGSSAPATLNFRHTVNQNGEAITMSDQNGLTYIGSSVGNNGFSVDATAAGVTGLSCNTATTRAEYHDIDDDDDPIASTEIQVNCTNATSCLVSYTGTAARGGAGGGPSPTPNPSATNTPTAGGCAAVSPSPAAGTYSGDGGCGISEAGYQVNGSTVILEPFGANGATSFAISPSEPATATSNVNTLTINGAAGYSCSITCSPPSTFTLSCFKEGGTSCTEKF